MDIISPTLLKFKGALFLFPGLLSAALILVPEFSLRSLLLLLITIWAFCRAYYFCFYVMHHYADPSFKYSGLLDLLKYLAKKKPGGKP